MNPRFRSAVRRTAAISAAVRQDPADLELPTLEQTDAWLAAVRARHGAAKALLCETILLVGLREEEACLLRMPKVSPTQLALGRPVFDWIEYGTKGGRMVGDPEKKGKPRKVRYPTALLLKLEAYRAGPRAESVAAARRAGRSEPKQLFLDPEGRPIQTNTAYRAWTACDALPYPGFSPHIGRHVFVCRLVLELLQTREKVAQLSNGTGLGTDRLSHVPLLIELVVCPLIGHASPKTTALYMKLLGNLLGERSVWSAYALHLDGR